MQWKIIIYWTMIIEMTRKDFTYLEPPESFSAAVRKQTQGDSEPKIWIQYQLTRPKISNMLFTALIDCGAIVSVLPKSTLPSIDSSLGSLKSTDIHTASVSGVPLCFVGKTRLLCEWFEGSAYSVGSFHVAVDIIAL